MVFAYCDPVVSLLVCTESDFSELNRFFVIYSYLNKVFIRKSKGK